MRIYDGGVLLIQNGGLDVTGTASISGSLSISGTLTQTGTSTFTGTTRLSGPTDIWGPLTVTGDTDLDGPTSITGLLTVTGDTALDGKLDIGGATTVTGDFTVTGPTKLDGTTDVSGDFTITGDTKLDGPVEVTGTLDIKGISTLRNDLDVVSGGRIKVGVMTLDPVAGGGRMEFDNGSVIAGSAVGLTLADGNATASLSLSMIAVLRGQGAAISIVPNQIQLNAPNTLIFGQIQAPNMDPVPGGQQPNVYYSPTSGLLYYVP